MNWCTAGNLKWKLEEALELNGPDFIPAASDPAPTAISANFAAERQASRGTLI